VNGIDFSEIEETFELLDEWEDRYRYVIELGRNLPPLPEPLRLDATKVDGCASQVWIVPRVEEVDGEKRLYFDGDSDAHIVKGLIAVLRAMLSGKTLVDIRRADPIAAFGRLGLEGQLSAQRTNGLRAMIEHIQQLASSEPLPF
jgi:cysteine desulfuration protein SufE